MAEIVVGIETEQSNHWAYEVQVIDAGVTYDYQVTLRWADYDLWSRGMVAPQKVIHAMFEFLLSRQAAAEILPKLDCSLIRRLFLEVDQVLPTML